MTREEAVNIIKECKEKGFKHTFYTLNDYHTALDMAIKALEQEQKTGHCKDCKWWKDSDGVYRRGIDAESQCPMNRKKVFEGNGYCYLYEPQESEEISERNLKMWEEIFKAESEGKE